MRPFLVPILLVSLVGLAVRLLAAGALPLLSDEAYYLLWSRAPAWGYHDQPPLIAWALAWVSLPDPALLLVRLPALVCALLGGLATAWVARSGGLAVAWWLGVPALLGLTVFATPDAPLLAAWAGVIAAASIGGRAWLLAGALAGIAVLAKHPGALAFPVAALALGPAEWRRPWPWLGAGVAALIVAPHLAWLGENDFITVRFQLAEGFASRPPGWFGPLRLLADQALVLGPVAAVAGVAAVVEIGWGRGRAVPAPVMFRHDSAARAARVGAWTAAIVLAVFLVASPFGEPEAHWPAPAWVGLGFVVASARAPWIRRTAWTGLGLGLAGALIVAGIAAGPLEALAPSLRARFTEGPALARLARALPPGPVLSERYHEAALIAALTGRPVNRPAGCGRGDQFDRWRAGRVTSTSSHAGAAAPAARASSLVASEDVPAGWAIRPVTATPGWCTDATWPQRGPIRAVERWQIALVRR